MASHALATDHVGCRPTCSRSASGLAALCAEDAMKAHQSLCPPVCAALIAALIGIDACSNQGGAADGATLGDAPADGRPGQRDAQGARDRRRDQQGMPLDTGPLPDRCPCPLSSYCDLTANRCVAGCLSDDHCPADRYCSAGRRCELGCRSAGCTGTDERCDPTARRCVCRDGTHRCNGRCVAENVQSCGASCEVCKTDPFGQTSCSNGRCTLKCASGYRDCGGSCAACPKDNIATLGCDGKRCVAASCAGGYHICSGSCALENAQSCGPSCATCGDTQNGACSNSACFGVVDLGYFPRATTCADVCTALGKTCADVCDIHDTRPNGTQFNTPNAGGFYTLSAAFQPYGWLKCAQQTPATTDPLSLKCCCTDAQTSTPKPGCTQQSDCPSYGMFCYLAKGECYRTMDPRCPPGYTYAGRCSGGGDICYHSALPTGHSFVWGKPCPIGTTERDNYDCGGGGGPTRLCLP